MKIYKTVITIKFTLEEVKALKKILGSLSKNALERNGLSAKEQDTIEPLYSQFYDALNESEQN